MDKIYVVYWSQSGNTQAMAEAVGAGITAAGKEAAVVDVSSVSTAELKNAKAGHSQETQCQWQMQLLKELRRQEKKQQFLKYQQ